MKSTHYRETRCHQQHTDESEQKKGLEWQRDETLEQHEPIIMSQGILKQPLTDISLTRRDDRGVRTLVSRSH